MRTAIKPRLVAFDLDGTLLGADKILTPRVLAAISRMRSRAIEGCVVTGRMYQAALPFVRQLHFTAPVVCYQGAAVIDPETDDVLLDTPLPNAEALELLAYAQENKLHIQLYANDRYYTQERNPFSELYANVSGVEPVIVPSLRAQFDTWDATKGVIIADPGVIFSHLAPVKRLFGDRAYVTRSMPYFLEVMDAKVDKGKALEIVANRLQIPISEVLAIGDSWNDAPLLKAAGFGVAMGSAPPELLDVADAVVADVTNDGVAEAIERFVLA
ncbi:MAG TPA: Cof-type HAD-IIB family hydrolase [Candidatus Baltobacteraceae bacterium]|jgi:hypothetical protein|nr:Cof-type HAD-IIB family hydrolase [Candidatus Baltobacteraceae bacterium]